MIMPLRLLAVPAIALLAAAPAMAQSEDFTRFQFNTTMRDYNHEVDEIADLQRQMEGERDRDTGCSLLHRTVYHVEKIRDMAADLARYAYSLDMPDAYDTFVEKHGFYGEYLDALNADIDRMCSN